MEIKRMNYIHNYNSPLGGITLASDGEALTGLWFDGQKYFGAGLLENSMERELPIFTQTEQWLKIYFSGQAPDFTPPLSMETTPFRKAVWEVLLGITQFPSLFLAIEWLVQKEV